MKLLITIMLLIRLAIFLAIGPLYFCIVFADNCHINIIRMLRPIRSWVLPLFLLFWILREITLWMKIGFMYLNKILVPQNVKYKDNNTILREIKNLQRNGKIKNGNGKGIRTVQRPNNRKGK